MKLLPIFLFLTSAFMVTLFAEPAFAQPAPWWANPMCFGFDIIYSTAGRIAALMVVVLLAIAAVKRKISKKLAAIISLIVAAIFVGIPFASYWDTGYSGTFMCWGATNCP